MDIMNSLQEYWFLFLTAPTVIKIALAIITFNLCLFIALGLFAGASFLIDRFRKNAYLKSFNKQKEFIIKTLQTKQIKTQTEIQLEFGKECGKLNRTTYYSLLPAITEIIEEQPKIQESENYRTLVLALQIDQHLERKLDFSSIENKLKIFHQLSKLKIVISDSKILPHTYSKNRYIRKGARNAYIGISNNNPFKFFDQADNHINNWDQIMLMEQLEIHHKNNLPNFSNWLKYSKNESQTIFLIKAAGYFKQYNTVNTLIQLLESENHDIRLESIRSLGLMQIQKVEDRLIELFNSQPTKCQDAIIEAVFNINSNKAQHFFKEAFEHAAQYESKLLIAEALHRYGQDDPTFFESLFQDAKGFNKAILAHVQNPLNPHKLKDPSTNNIVVLDSREEEEKNDNLSQSAN